MSDADHKADIGKVKAVATNGVETAKNMLGFSKENLGSVLGGIGIGMVAAVLFGAVGEIIVGGLFIAAGVAVNRKLVGRFARRLADMDVDGGMKMK
ncbi:MAG: hypothetical protein VR70_03995 [Rhodospirillaceae bacterium BRH_c57]|nr:MAG: hypothetical protein VR70_03995 [Rhodospirillaceae bacterium BRH_c57]